MVRRKKQTEIDRLRCQNYYPEFSVKDKTLVLPVKVKLNLKPDILDKVKIDISCFKFLYYFLFFLKNSTVFR